MEMVDQVEMMDWIQIVRAEYLEIPGLNLTRPQVERLWGLDPATSEALLDELIAAGFLRLTETNGYVRADCGS